MNDASVLPVLAALNDFVWGWFLVVLLLGTHLFLTFRLGFIQRRLFQGIRLSFSRDGGRGQISPFGAFATALGGTVGTGNISGVATALVAGGPGAIFWMWIGGFFGIASRYAEAVLAVRYRHVDEAGERIGGPMFVLRKGLHSPFLAIAFAFFTVLSALGSGNAVQANSIALLADDTFGIPTYISGLAVAGLTAIVIFRGIRGIAIVSELIVPLMSAVYIAGCLYLLWILRDHVPDAILRIVQSAFQGEAAAGGFAGAGVKEALRYGSARGLFSNEAGQGSAPMAAAAARTPNAVHQGLVQASTVFWDTIILCALTGIVLVAAGDWLNQSDGMLLSMTAFKRIPHFGPELLNLCLYPFAFTTILGWSYYGEVAAEFLWGRGSIFWYRVAAVATAWIGAVVTLDAVWIVSDLTTGLMALPNLLAMLLLSNQVKRETDRFIDRVEESDETLP